MGEAAPGPLKASRRARRGFLAAAALALVVTATACVLFLPPPPRLVRWIAQSNAEWLLSNYMEPTRGPLSRARNAGRKVIATYVQYGLAAAIPSLHPLPRDLSDVDRLSARLVWLRSVMISNGEVAHAPGQWSSLLSAVGSCDQVNAVAANVLGREFDRAQIVGLFEPATRRGHTVGRVWSRETNDWLYFDVWGSVVIFRVDSRGGVTMLRSVDLYPGSIPAARMASVADMYGLAASGDPYSEYPSTLGGFMYLRARRMIQRRTLDSLAAAPAIAARAAIAPRAPAPSVDVRRRFARAQLARLFGDTAEATREFQRIAAEDGRSTLGRAAALSARRLASQR